MKKKTAIITGASKGIGRTLAYHFSEIGYDLLLVARSIDLLTDLQLTIKDRHPEKIVEIAAIDIANEVLTHKAISKFITENNHVDVLINNAGYVKRGTSEIDSHEMTKMIEVNLKGLINITKATVPYMKKRNSGYIINMSSRNAKTPRSFLGVYAATKAAVLAYNESLYKELVEFGIKVTAIAPGFVNTHMTSDVPLDRDSLIQPEEICKVIDFLLSLTPSVALKEICFEATPQVGAYA